MTAIPESTKQVERDDGIAVIGLACRFAGAHSLAEFWALLNPDPVPGSADVAFDAKLASIDSFDAEFFRTTEAQARYIDPQQRLLLELAWEALEDGAVPPRDLRGSRTGTFVGLCNHDHSVMLWPQSSNPHMLAGILNSLAANRISHFFGLTGPSLCVDTACSSSLSAVHLACQSLRSGECSQALAAGVNLMTFSGATETMRNAGLLSGEGRCRPFESEADGFVRAEGGGVVLLKPYRDALRDGNRIYAVIEGSAVNYNGDANGLTNPSPQAQRELLERAYRVAGIDPREVGYVEASATGSKSSDALEGKTFVDFFLRERTASHPTLAIGTSKPAIGHVEGLSGIASLIKVALAFQEGAMPGYRRAGTLNPTIGADGKNVTFLEKSQRWEAGNRVAGISSLGFGGANAHIVVREPPKVLSPAVASNPGASYVLPLSARTMSALRALLASYEQLLRAEPQIDLYSLCYTAATGRDHFSARCAFVARDTEDLLRQIVNAQKELATSDVSARGVVAPQTYACLNGVGTVEMGLFRRLCDESATMRALVDEVEREVGTRIDVDADWASVVRHADQSEETSQLSGFLAEYCLAKFVALCCPKIQGFVAEARSELVRLVLVGAIGLDAAARIASSEQPWSMPSNIVAGARMKPPRRSAHIIGISWATADAGAAALRHLIAPNKVRSWHSLAEHESLSSFLAAAYAAGTEIDWRLHYPSRPRSVAKLPLYPFQRLRYWPTELGDCDRGPKEFSMRGASLRLLRGERMALPFSAESRYAYKFHAHSGSALMGSRVFGTRMVTPATQVMMVTAHLASDTGERANWLRLQNIRMTAPIALPDDTAISAQLIVSAGKEPGHGHCVFVSGQELRDGRSEADWSVVMEADYATLPDCSKTATSKLAKFDRSRTVFDAEASKQLHERLSTLGYECDAAHRWDLSAGSGEYWLGNPLRGSQDCERVHPGMLDACLLTLLLQLDLPGAGDVWLPVSIDRLDLCTGDLNDGIFSIRITARTSVAEKTTVDFEVANSYGRKVLIATGVNFVAVPRAAIENQWNCSNSVPATAGDGADMSLENVTRHLMGTLQALLGSVIDDEMLVSPLVRLGLDSLKALELRLGLKRDYGYAISQVDMLNGLSGAALIARIRAHLEQRGGILSRETTKTQLIELRARHSQDRLVQIEL
ncbi:MAG TPA: beta-ketoacyl synthase N-terminal-like domain-containing protein [Steroidobacteraceae bacterium]|nr:beta-ketoacyl synthase N-terminal-like domain-containing protein [Steroidobacteraceae bacterium]